MYTRVSLKRICIAPLLLFLINYFHKSLGVANYVTCRSLCPSGETAEQLIVDVKTKGGEGNITADVYSRILKITLMQSFKGFTFF